MSGRRHQAPGVVRFVCVDQYHEGNLEVVTAVRFTGEGLICREGSKRATEGRYPDGRVKWYITCRCGVDVKRSLDDLNRTAAALFAADAQATRVDIEISTLRGVTSGTLGELSGEQRAAVERFRSERKT